jgi:2-desacetyl-2-hydroxyethyl bacteriochlorophyllide A dehydrogenase
VKAAVLEQFGQPLVVAEVPDPEPAHGEVVVGVGAAGICRTDLKIIDGAIPTVELPRVLGHEPAGEVVGLGPGVDPALLGQRVVVGLDVSCGDCLFCRSGKLDYCEELQRLGFERDGALAELLAVPAENLVPIADHVPFAQAATIPDAIGSTYHAIVRRAAVEPSHVVAVYGLGGLGLAAVQIAVLFGASVVAIARSSERRRLAEELGARWSFDSSDGGLPEYLREITGGIGVDAFIDLVGIEGSVAAGVRSCRKGGRVVVLANAVPQMSAETRQLVYREISIVGSRGSTRRDLHQAAELVAAGRIKPVIDAELPLDRVNEGLDRLRDQSVVGRILIRTSEQE